MDNDLFEKGLEMRKGTLGAEYVEGIWPRRMTLPARFRRR